jgi:hypothetical protein
MKIQSLSVVVPAKKCVNDCKFCVSKMHVSEYETMISDQNLYYDLYKKDFINRLAFARDNGCNTAMLTGDCEPLQNRSFLTKFGDFNQTLPSPFKIVEIQTVGNLLTPDYLYFLRHHVGVTTISLSVSDLWSSANNASIIGCDFFSIEVLCVLIKKYRFSLRLSLNMTDFMYDHGSKNIYDILDRCEELGADQITFREMYENDGVRDEEQWVRDYNIGEDQWNEIYLAVQEGTEVDKLEYGRVKYDVRGIGVVIDDDCMSKQAGDVAKYLILRPDCKLYSKWDTKASLIF